MRPSLLALIGLSLLAVPASAASRPVVVELFTSQSCSSCPPAEALLTAFARERADLLPLAFHVTYWNRLNWRDTVSLPAATERQNAYAAQLGEGVFTPQMVVDGRRSVVGSQAGEVAAAIAQARKEVGDATPIDFVRKGDAVVVTVGRGSGRGRLVLVGFDADHRTRVTSGENAGRDLTQSNVVRSVRAIGDWTGAARTFSEPVPVGADAAVILQADDGRILGAARLAKAGS
ncbi:DUF1223 domain-containing protein [uncultured Methylobacterium sp.]|jgi:hypothetical protein|uniref:DUF1223 domain-containing protein n=1 Tax=uncultured Methylobacterium sp. TaxID=157278 RepID=UPI0035CACEF6